MLDVYLDQPDGNPEEKSSSHIGDIAEELALLLKLIL
jgi:hypothetical protein